MLQEGTANTELQKIYSYLGTRRTGSCKAHVTNRPSGAALLAEWADFCGCFWMAQDGDVSILYNSEAFVLASQNCSALSCLSGTTAGFKGVASPGSQPQPGVEKACPEDGGV